MKMIPRIAALAVLAFSAPMAYAQEAETVAKMRNAHMELQAYSFGILGNMARGKQPYDAALATQAAENLHALAASDWGVYLIPGSSMNEVPGSEASPDIWLKMDDFLARKAALEQAAAALPAQVGDGVNGLRAGVMGMSKACSGCHTGYRVKQ